MFNILSKAFFTATRTGESPKASARPTAPWRNMLPRLTAFPDA